MPERNISRLSKFSPSSTHSSLNPFTPGSLDHQQLEQELRTQHAFFREVIDLNPNFIFAKDRQGRFTLVNKAVADAYGTTVSDLIGKSDADFNPKREEVDHFRNDDIEVMDSLCEKLIPEERITDASGRTRWLQTVKRPLVLNGNKAEQVLGVATDISERKQFEKTLTEIAHIVSASSGQQLFDAVACYITKTFGFYCAAVGVLSNDNPDEVSTLSFAISGTLGPNFTYALKGTPCERVIGRDICYYRSSVAKLFPEDAFLREHGIESYIGVPLFTSAGKEIGIVAMCDQKPLENEASALSLITILSARVATDLEHRHNEQERRDLEAQLRHAQKLESLGVLAGGIAHDFNNLLVGVLGNAALALSDIPQNCSAADKVRKIKTTAERAAELTNQLLAYSGKGKFSVEAIDLSELVREMGELLSSIISKKARLHYVCLDDLPVVDGDPTQIRQVIMNLMTNASDSLGGKPGNITVTTNVIAGRDAKKRTTTVGDINEHARYVCIEVSDTGCGMDQDTVSRIFDPFFTTKFAGRGLGLSAVMGILIGHQGAIQVESLPSAGTTIRVLLPVGELTRREKSGRRLDEANTTPSPQHGTVLVVDDEPSVREVTCAILVRYGYKVLEAEDGIEGLAMIKKHLPTIDVVLVDMTMPRMGGDELIAELHNLNPTLPIVLTSGYSEHENHSLLFGKEHISFIQKPFQPVDLVAKLQLVRGTLANKHCA